MIIIKIRRIAKNKFVVSREKCVGLPLEAAANEENKYFAMLVLFDRRPGMP
jgi:hypothetical protein